jgi:DNA-binding protein Alba
MSKANSRSKNTSENVAAEGQTAAPEKKPRPERTSPPNHIFIGKKPVMSYAMSALIQLAQMGEVILKARGMVISRAVDVAEIITKRLGNNAYEVKSIVIDTEQLGVGEDMRNVSTIEIKVGKK